MTVRNQSQIYTAVKTEVSDLEESEWTGPGISSAIRRGAWDVLQLYACEGPDLLITAQQRVVGAAKAKTRSSAILLALLVTIYKVLESKLNPE